MESDDPMVVAGTYIKDRSLRDGTRRIEIDLEREQARRFMEMLDGQTDIPLAIARLDEQKERDRMQREMAATDEQPATDPGTSQPRSYGQAARRLHVSGFFRSPDVWRAAGTDEQYAQWCRKQVSAVSGDYDTDPDTGEIGCVYAHVRRVSEGAGTGIKPAYCGIPLTDAEHRRQHAQGESAIVPARHKDDAKAYIERLRIEYVSAWSKAVIKAELGYESSAQIPPAELRAWAERRGVEQYLPHEYAEA